MTPGAVDAFLARLERELRQRGLEHSRLVVEAREHLLDIVAEGRQRGLPLDEAEREACERFGLPEAIAAQAVPEGEHIMGRLTAILDTAWRRKWWIVAPTLLAAVVTAALSAYLLLPRYQSETVIRILQPQVPLGSLPTAATDRARGRLELISQTILSRSRLERLIDDFDLYQAERARAPIDDVVLEMRRNIFVSLLSSDRAQENDVGRLRVGFISPDPKTAMRITERLASLFVEENLREREGQVSGTSQFLDGEIDDLRKRIIAAEERLDALRAKSGGRPPSQADLLPYEVLQERYKALLFRAEESRSVTSLERRQLGEQFRVLDPARLPERPVGPSRLSVNAAGTFAGFALGVVLVGLRGRSKTATD